MIGIVVDVEIDYQKVEHTGVGCEGDGLADARQGWDYGAGGDVFAVGMYADGEVVVFAHGVVEEIVAAVDGGGTIVGAVDGDGHIDVGERLVVGGVEEEAGVGEIDKELFVG